MARKKKITRTRAVKPKETRRQTGANAVRGIVARARYMLAKAGATTELARDAYTFEAHNENITRAENLVAVAASHLKRAKHTAMSWNRDRNMRANGHTNGD